MAESSATHDEPLEYARPFVAARALGPREVAAAVVGRATGPKPQSQVGAERPAPTPASSEDA